MGAAHLGELRQDGVLGHHDVAEQHVEGVVARLGGSAQHGMTQAKRFLLVDIGNRQRAGMVDGVGVLVLAAAAQHLGIGGVGREVALDERLGHGGHDDAAVALRRGEGLLSHMLDDRAVEHRQHLLGNEMRRRKEARAQASGRNDCFH